MATQVVTLEFYVDVADVFLNLEFPWEAVADGSVGVKIRGCGPNTQVLFLTLHLPHVEAR